MGDPLLRPYRVILSSRLRSQWQYRTSLIIDVVSSVGVGLAELTEIFVIFHNVPRLGGLDVTAAVLLFSLANLSFSLAELITGHLDELNDWLRAGTLDILLVRPLPVLAQLILTDITLKRLGRAALALAVMVIALGRLEVTWTPARVVQVLITPIAGAAIFSALFIAAAALQFRLIDGREFANGFTYGGAYAAAFPTGMFALPLRIFYTFVVPAAFVAYLPTLAILGRPAPIALPAGFGFGVVPAAVVSLAVALLLWRDGIRHYQGGGG